MPGFQKEREALRPGSEQGANLMATAAIKQIPLNKLVNSPKNVRKTPASEADDAELYASLRSDG